MASYYPITPVKKRNTVSYDTAGAKKAHSPTNKNTLDDYDHGTPGLVEESPARSSGATSEHDVSLPNTPGSPLYVRASAHMQRRRSNTLPFQSSTRMFTAVEGEDGTELLSDDYSQSPDHGVFQTKINIIEPEDDGYVEQSLDIPSVSVNVDSPETSTTPDQNQDGDLSDLAKNGLPSACIFVANLAASQTDDQLMKSLQAHFRQFGRLHVKIRRDSKGNPYSFCQFETDEAARVAVRHGRNAIIDSTGRRIRCEPAKVNRTLVLSKHDGSVATKAEVEKLIFGFGSYEALEFAEDENSAPVHNLTQGPRCFVRFTLRQDAVDCYQYFRFHATWGAEWTNNFSTHGTAPAPMPIAVDPFSVFVGKLDPDKTTESELRKRFGEHGTIVECNLVNKSDGRAAFAFIKYSTKEEAIAAVEKENNAQFMGNVIHVQKRELHRKTGRGAAFSPRQNPVQSPVARERTPYITNTDPGNQTVSLPLHVYNNLMETYRQGQANHQLRMRNPSVISSVSNATTYDPANLGLLYAPDPVTPQPGMVAGGNFMFHHPFQAGPAGFGNSPSGATQNHASPRNDSGRSPIAQQGERSPGSPAATSDSVPYNFSPGHLFPGYYNMHGGPGSAFFGGFHPSQMTPRFPTDDSSTRRESFASNFDVPPQFTASMDKLAGGMANMGFGGHHQSTH